jgi:Cu2+-exporting ATPase
VEAAGPGAPAEHVEETVGEGVRGRINGSPARLGRRAFVGADAGESGDASAELWFVAGEAAPVRFAFVDALRPDARETVAALEARGVRVELLSGDRAPAVAAAAREVGISRWEAAVRPEEKVARLAQLAAAGARVLMVGDGLNDAAAMANAHASASPSAAADISQAASDIVFSGQRLGAVVEAIDVARAARRRVHENLGFSALYNVVAVPAAVCGLVTPLIAALAMSGSSLVVTLNALRVRRTRPWT